jgi:mono/diheme cytochrome c family protein
MAMRRSKIRILVALMLLGGIHPTFAQNAGNGHRLSERWCSECHAIESASGERHRAPSFASIAAGPTINADMIASFLLLPHATMPNPPLSRKDAQDIALFIIEMKK